MKTTDIFNKAQWIWEKEERKNSYVGAYKKLTLSSAPKKISISLFADTHYKLYVNGQFVNAGPAPFAKPVIMADTYDITSLLKKGSNDIFILSHFVGVTVKYNRVDKPGIIATVNGSCSDKTKLEVTTGPDWKIFPITAWNENTPKKNWAIGFIEDVYLDSPSYPVLEAYAIEDYGNCDNKPTASQIAKFAKKPRCYKIDNLTVRDRIVPYLTWTKEQPLALKEIFRDNPEVYLLADSIRLDNEYVEPENDNAKYHMVKNGTVELQRRKGEKGFIVLYDMMRMTAGDISIEIESSSKCIVDVQHTESIRNGRQYGSRIGSVYYTRLHLKKGLNRFRVYNFCGFRYIGLITKDFEGSLNIKKVITHECHGDVPFADTICSGDTKIDNIYDISRRSIILNGQANTYDCNSREQGTYWGDSLWIVDCVGHMSGDFSYMKHLCVAITDEVELNGTIAASLYGLSNALFDYSLVPMDLLNRYYDYTEDKETVVEQIAACENVIDQFRNFKDESGFVVLANIQKDERYERGLLFLDHPGTTWHPRQTVAIDRDDYNAGINLFYLKALQCMEELYKKLKIKKSLNQEINELKKNIFNFFYDKEKGLIKDACNPKKKEFAYSQITNCLAVMTGVLTGESAKFAIKQIVDIERNTWISQGTPYSYFFICEALAKLGMVEEGIETIKKYWMPMIERGATTTWEAFGGENHDSLNHAWSAPLPYLIYKGVVGLEQEGTGYKKLTFKPCLAAFDNFAYEFSIPQGKISVKWNKINTKEYDLSIKVPKNLPATLEVNGKNIKFSGNIHTTL